MDWVHVDKSSSAICFLLVPAPNTPEKGGESRAAHGASSEPSQCCFLGCRNIICLSQLGNKGREQWLEGIGEVNTPGQEELCSRVRDFFFYCFNNLIFYSYLALISGKYVHWDGHRRGWRAWEWGTSAASPGAWQGAGSKLEVTGGEFSCCLCTLQTCCMRIFVCSCAYFASK